MSCCKAEKYKWCKDLPGVYMDDEGKKYCVFHAPQGKKGTSVKGFNALIFKKITNSLNAACRLDGTVFEGDISFSQFNKDNPLPYLSFSEAIFNGDTYVGETTFSEGVDFSGVTFNKEAGFLGTTFNGRVLFWQATFNGNAYFARTTFREKANFSEAKFSKETYFVRTTFRGKPYFFGTTFSEKTAFGETIFSENVNFSEAKFIKEVDFGKTTFSKKANFCKTEFNKRSAFAEIVIVEKIKFEGVNLSAHSFIDTDLTKIDFINCDWHKSYGRNVLYDELCLFKSRNDKTQDDEKTKGILHRCKQKLRQEWAGFLKDISCDKEGIKKVEILYRQLKRKCKEEHNDVDISDWHYGEKEMYRKGNRFKRFFPFSLSNLYWLSSGYGERPKRAGIVLICLILLVSVLFGFAGLIPNSEPRLAPINEIKDLVKNPFEVLVNTLQYATFEKDTYFMPQNIWGTFLKILAKLFIPLQAALFAFSVRNRFKR